jgi:hypothetical protein
VRRVYATDFCCFWQDHGLLLAWCHRQRHPLR